MGCKSPSAVQNRDPNRIYVIPAEGGSPEPISSGKSDLDPTWSKDGSALMYGVLPVPGDPEPTQIMLLDLKTRAVTQVAAQMEFVARAGLRMAGG